MTSDASTLLTAALRHAALGYKVLLVAPNGKLPAEGHGLRHATGDPAVIRSWFDGCTQVTRGSQPKNNLAIVPPENALVLDVDEADRLADLLATYPELTQAPMTRTPSGGAHLYSQVPNGWTRPATVRVWPGVDVRGLNRTYALVPPSTFNNRRYVMERSLVPVHLLPPAGDQLLRRLTPSSPPPIPLRAIVSAPRHEGYAAAALANEATRVATTPPGSRNDTLNRAAFSLGQLIATGDLDRAEVELVLTAAAEQCGLEAREISRTITSGISAGMRRLRLSPSQSPQSLLRALFPSSTVMKHPSQSAQPASRIAISADLLASVRGKR